METTDNQKVENLPPILTTEQVAELFQVSTHHIRKNVEYFGGVRFSHKVIRFPRQRIENLLGGYSIC